MVLAAPATASTLSRLMLTSARATPQAALAKLLAGVEARMLVAGDLVRAGALALVAQLAPHPPRDPQQQQAAGEDQADDLEQLA